MRRRTPLSERRWPPRRPARAAAEWCELHVDQFKASTKAIEAYITWLDNIGETLDTIGSQCRSSAKAENFDQIERVRVKAVEIIAKAKGSVEGLRKEFLRHEEAHGKNAPVAIKYEDIPTSLVAINDALDIAARKAEDARPDPDEDQGRGGGFVIGEFDQQW